MYCSLFGRGVAGACDGNIRRNVSSVVVDNSNSPVREITGDESHVDAGEVFCGYS